ncbi:MAG: Rrf2 family transcriptional regulator [candidate division WOR-3 bacterium]
MSDLFNVSEAARLALHALFLLSRSEKKRWTVSRLADSLGVSQAHLAKVLARLEHAGLVKGQTGPAGGYCLARAPGKITLLSIYQAMEGKLQTGRCPFAVPVCQGDGCPLGKFFQKIDHQVISCLKKTTIAQIKIKIGGGNEKRQKKSNQN